MLMNPEINRANAVSLMISSAYKIKKADKLEGAKTKEADDHDQQNKNQCRSNRVTKNVTNPEVDDQIQRTNL